MKGPITISSVPPGNIYLHLNPVEINFDEPTVWWLREFIGKDPGPCPIVYISSHEAYKQFAFLNLFKN